jgi:hypothetical protein
VFRVSCLRNLGFSSNCYSIRSKKSPGSKIQSLGSLVEVGEYDRRWDYSQYRYPIRIRTLFALTTQTTMRLPFATAALLCLKPSASDKAAILAQSSFLGSLYQIPIKGPDAAAGWMACPTYGCQTSDKAPVAVADDATATTSREVEGLLGKLGPAFVLDDVLTPDICRDIIETCEALDFGNFQRGTFISLDVMQLVVSKDVTNALAERLSSHIESCMHEVEARRREMEGGDENDDNVRLVFAGLNRRWRIYKYAPGGMDFFAPHIDAAFPSSGLNDKDELVWDLSSEQEDKTVSRLTILMYLNDDFEGGETNFYTPKSSQTDDSNQGEASPALIASVRPVTGSCLFFPQGVGESAVAHARIHWPLHEGSPVLSGRTKYVIRSDILFTTQRESIQEDNMTNL